MLKSLIPWKRGNGNITVRRNEPTRAEDRDYYPLARLREEFDSLLNQFFETRLLGDRMFSGLPSLWNDPQFNWNWDLGLEDRNNEYVFRAELPGFEPEDFDIKVSGNVLTVRAEHKDEKKGKNGSSYRYGSFTRTFSLPHGVDDQNIDARYHSGVLEVHLPKTEKAKGKRIEVQSV